MRDEPELADWEGPGTKPGCIWFTRRRWDAYFLPTTVVGALFGLAAWWLTARPGALAFPLMVAGLWALVRWNWPSEGSLVPTLTATPGTVVLLGWLAIWGFVGLGGIIGLDLLLPFPPRGLPWAWRPALIVFGSLLAWFAGLLVGVARIERRTKKPGSRGDRRLE